MIRTAIPLDAAAITSLWNQIISQTTITFTTTLKTKAEVLEIIADPARLVHIAEHNGTFAGFALVGTFRGGVGYAQTVEHTLYVHQTQRGAGLGTALMQTLEEAATVAGHHVMVGGVSSSNANAIAFHKKIGFQQVGLLPQVGRKNGEWLDLVLMQKILQNAH